jgi:pectinesterase
VSVVLVACVVVGLAVGIPLGLKKARETVTVAESDNGITNACKATSYPATCNQTFSGGNYTVSSLGVTKYSVTAASTGINNTLASVLGLNTTDEKIAAAVEVCLETLGLSLEQLDTALATLKNSTSASILQTTLIKDIRAWVSAALELHTTCIDAFLEVNTTLGTSLQTNSSHTDELLSNALAFLASFEAYGDDLQSWKASGFSLPNNFSLSDLTKGIHFPNLTGLGHRRLLSSQLIPEENSGLPSWVDAKVQRHLLQTASNSSYDAVVAKDVSGNYTTIQAAVDAAPQKSSKRYTIYIKAGTYTEQVNVNKTTKNLVFIGDGMNQTIITGSLHVANSTNMTTFKSATLSKFQIIPGVFILIWWRWHCPHVGFLYVLCVVKPSS